LERHCRFAQLLLLFPLRPNRCKPRLRGFAGRGSGRFGPLRGLEPVVCLLPGRLQLGCVRESGAQPFEPGTERRSLVLQAILGRSETLVTQHAREELSALGGAHRGHHGQIFLPGEVGIEEFVARHAQETSHPLRDRPNAVRDRGRISVLIELGVRQRPDDAILVGTQCELNFDFDSGLQRRAPAAQRLPATPGSRHAVHGPGDRLEQRGLARAVGSDDSGEAGTELYLGVLVLAKILEAQAVDLHQPPAKSRSTLSIKSRPRRTNASRSSSAGKGRCWR
jgi:hypothetical protein